MRQILAGIVMAAVACGAARGAENVAEQLPEFPPLAPAEALASFRVLPGYRFEQVAAEPLVHSPVAMAFDERGRLYVVEMIDYSEQENESLGAVRLLEDTDGDGRFDKSTIFAEHLSWPTALICYDGGVFIGAPPEIVYCKDVDGDGRADKQERVFTGFNRTNVQGLLNSFQWGLDGRIYGAASSCGGLVTCVPHPERAGVDCRRRDFSFDPRTLDFRTESGGAQHGMTFDDWGRRFECSNSDHLQMIMYDDRYAARNRCFSMPPSRLSIAAEGPQAAIFRASPPEPWRILRSEWRKTGRDSGAVEWNGAATGYFTSATGVTCYRGDAFPAEWREEAVVADVGSNIIHRKKLEPAGVALVGRRIDERSEVVASTDTWFRPVQFANAPDGALYVLDMYRQVIEHPKSIPAEIKKHLDLTNGRDRGRIYRLAPEGFTPRVAPRLDEASTEELVATLSHRNGWHRDTAARLLYERNDAAAWPLLTACVCEASLPEARLQALYLLRQGHLTDEVLLTALGDSHPRVREHAIRVAEDTLVSGTAAPAVRERLASLAGDPDPRVRYQLAFTLGVVPVAERIAPLARIAARDPGDKWIEAAVFSALSEGAGALLARLIDDPHVLDTEQGRGLLGRVSQQVAACGTREDMKAAEDCVAALERTQPAAATAIIRGLSVGHARAARGGKTPVAESQDIEAAVARILEAARRAAGDESRSVDDRADAIASLSLGTFAEEREALAPQLEPQSPPQLQMAALATLREFDDPAVADVILSAWPSLTPRLRAAAADAIFSRAGWIKRLFAAIDAGEMSLNDVDPAQLQVLENHRDKKLRAKAKELLQQMRLGRRDDVVQDYQNAITSLTGDAARGKKLFAQHCSACHRLEETGYAVGPNLASFRARGPEAIVMNVLDPNREVNPQYVVYAMQDTNGRPYSGMIVNENDNSLSLGRGENVTETVLRAEIDGPIMNTGRSLMPEGLERAVDHQAMADLIAYIMSQE